MDRLVLDLVVLVTQRLALVDMEDLADVLLRMGPDQLVAPGLIYPLSCGWEVHTSAPHILANSAGWANPRLGRRRDSQLMG